jgi:hypothetical protein
MTPIRQVIIPATNNAPPPMNIGRSMAQANMLPERIVSRQELAAAAVRTGPMTTIIIPKMKMSDLNFSRHHPISGLSGSPRGLLCQIVHFKSSFQWPDVVWLFVGKFSRDFTAVFEQQLCDVPASFCTKYAGGFEFKIVKNVMQADIGGARSLPLVRFDRGIGLNLAAVYEGRPDEP